MAYIYGSREQISLLPESIEQYVSEEDPVRAYDAFIDALDFEQLGIELNSHSVGPPQYDPIAMLKILVYGYSYGWRSSRKLERALNHNVSFMWLAGGLKPDFKTINTFRSVHKQALKNTLRFCARICVKFDLIEGNTLFVDGSKFRANAGNSQTKSKSRWEQLQAGVEKRIEDLIGECERVDLLETESLVKMQKGLRSKKKLKLKIAAILGEIKQEKTINQTDPDCKILRGRQGSHAGYNTQAVVDDSQGLLASLEAVSHATDHHQMKEQVDNAEENLDISCKNACADAGYHDVDALKPLVQGDKMIIVPSNRQALRKPSEDTFGKDAFIYNREKDTYTCPAGEEMYRSYQAKGCNKITYRMKRESACKVCKHYGNCTNAKRGRTIIRMVNEDTKQELEKLYLSEIGQEIYAKRKMRVELPFGHLKRNLGAGTFLLRGLEGVNAELGILGTCFNIARMITLLGGVRPMVAKMKKIKVVVN
jgi:transposase